MFHVMRVLCSERFFFSQKYRATFFGKKPPSPPLRFAQEHGTYHMERSMFFFVVCSMSQSEEGRGERRKWFARDTFTSKSPLRSAVKTRVVNIGGLKVHKNPGYLVKFTMIVHQCTCMYRDKSVAQSGSTQEVESCP